MEGKNEDEVKNDKSELGLLGKIGSFLSLKSEKVSETDISDQKTSVLESEEPEVGTSENITNKLSETHNDEKFDEEENKRNCDEETKIIVKSEEKHEENLKIDEKESKIDNFEEAKSEINTKEEIFEECFEKNEIRDNDEESNSTNTNVKTEEESDRTNLEPSESAENESDDSEGEHEGTFEEDSEIDESERSSERSESEVGEERGAADGQADKKEKKLDHDEDKRDPQYIPKKGNFYEHDDRTSETDEPPPTQKKQVQPKFEKERWGHDLYDEELQSPKSRQELIDQYGYDIREEDGPPKARRRRRYGRGPNKYTRHWEEEEAYAKSKGSWRARGTNPPKKSLEEFPPLPQTADKFEKNIDKESPKIIENKIEPRSNDTVVIIKDSEENVSERKPLGSGRGRGRIINSSAPPPSLPQTQGGRMLGQRKNVPPSGVRLATSNKSETSRADKLIARETMSKSTAEEDIATLSQHFSQAVINVDNKSIIPPRKPQDIIKTKKEEKFEKELERKEKQNTQVANTPPRENTEKIRQAQSKRYSTQRQRVLTEVQTGRQQNLTQIQPQIVPGPRPPYIPPPETFYHQGPGMEPPSQPPPQFTPNQPPPPTGAAYGGPEVGLMTFMSTAPPPGAGYMAGPPPYCPHPSYIPPPPIVQAGPTPGAELFQTPGGLTYYSTQGQVQRTVPSRRLKLAIPIVPPPQADPS